MARTHMVAGVALAFGIASIVIAVDRITLEAPAQRWSDPATWHGRVPERGDDVTIARGRRVTLDVDPPALGTLRVDGELDVPARDARLEARNIFVRGRFSIGSEWRPFDHRARIVLHPGTRGDGLFTASEGGRIDLFGPPKMAWTHLGATAFHGTRLLRLAEAPDWNRGDRIAIAPTGFASSESEEARIASVDGTTIGIEAPLRFTHFGEVTEGIDERAEVGVLSHAISVESAAGAPPGQIGGQVVVYAGGTLRASGVEFSHLGRAGTLGAYPVHFHLAGDARGSFVDRSSIDHSYNRCLTLHGTANVRVDRDVAYDTVGHCYFLEDADEAGNVFDGDLALDVRAPREGAAILASDARPAGFWISNPANTIANDVAAGTDGVGFWYDLPVHPGGAARDRSIAPRGVALGTFAHDVAHSNDHDGLFVDNLRNPPGVVEAPNYAPSRPAIFEDFETYKNRRHGAWLRGTSLFLHGARVADNAIGVTFAGAGDELSSSLVVGESANRTGPPKPDDPSFPIRGFEFYDGTVGVRDTRFVAFEPNAARAASALAALRFSPFFTSPRNYSSGLSFDRALPLFFEAPAVAANDRLGGDGYRSNVFIDRDGSLTGTAGSAVVIAAPLLVDPDCTRRPDWNAAICPPAFASLFLADLDKTPAGDGPLRIARLDVPNAGIVVLHGNPRDPFTTSFEANVRTDQRYAVRFLQAFPRHVRVSLRNLTSGGSADIVFANAPADSFVFSDGSAREAIARRGEKIVVSLGTRTKSTYADICARSDCR